MVGGEEGVLLGYCFSHHGERYLFFERLLCRPVPSVYIYIYYFMVNSPIVHRNHAPTSKNNFCMFDSAGSRKFIILCAKNVSDAYMKDRKIAQKQLFLYLILQRLCIFWFLNARYIQHYLFYLFHAPHFVFLFYPFYFIRLFLSMNDFSMFL